MPLLFLESSGISNLLFENTRDIRHRDIKYCPPGNSIDPLNIIQSRDPSLAEIRLSDSLEDIVHMPNRSSLLPDTRELEEINRELTQNRGQTFNEFFRNTYILPEEVHWSLPTPRKRPAPPRPPLPDLGGPRVPKTVREDCASNCEISDRSSIDSGASLHSDFSGNCLTVTYLK